MTLTFRAVSLNDQPIAQPIVGRMGAQGGTIGRADSNTLPLPDPERRISRRQAEITLSGSVYSITNIGSANPIIVCDQSLAQGESAPVRPGDQVRIGGYLLEVTDSEAGDDRTELVPPAPAANRVRQCLWPPARLPARKPAGAAGQRRAARGAAFSTWSSSPFADLGGSVSPGNPFAELLGDPPAPMSASSRSDSAPAPSRLPDDFDPFAAPPPPAAPPRVATSAAGIGFEDLIPSAAPASIDDMFGLRSGSARDPLSDFLSQAPPPGGSPGQGAGSGSLSTDPLALFGAAKEALTPAVPQTPPDQTPELRAAFVPPKPMPPVETKPRVPAALPKAEAAPSPASSSPSAAPRPGGQPIPQEGAPPNVAAPSGRAAVAAHAGEPADPSSTGWSRDALEVWNALCEGAGVQVEPPPHTGPAFMRVIGMMLRASVDGTVKLMAMRSATRQELQAQVTVIRARNNNPLKFAPDGQSALEQILRPAVRGFLPGPAAVNDAMDDLLGHAIGTMAGTRAALEGVLKRFEPQELERQACRQVGARQRPADECAAKLWELYLQHYEALRDEAQEDFHALFGRAFLAAYEQQLERLRREKSATTK